MSNETTGQTMFYQTRGFNYGWICPKCGSVYNPTQTECNKCNPNTKYELTSTSIAMDDYKNHIDNIKTYYGGNTDGKHSNE